MYSWNRFIKYNTERKREGGSQYDEGTHQSAEEQIDRNVRKREIDT